MNHPLLVPLEAAFKAGQYGRVIFLADQALEAAPPREVRPHIYYLKGSALVQSGPAWQGEAISCFREGIAASGRNRPVKAKLMACLAKVYADIGDEASCSKLMKEFERIRDDKNLEVVRYAAWLFFAYGYTLDNAFRYQEAIAVYEQVADMARRSDQPAMVGHGLHNLGGVYVTLGRLPEALAAMTEAESLLPAGAFGHKLLSRRAEYGFKAGDLTCAQQYITEALLHPSTDDFTRADIHHTWAKVLLALGCAKEARDKALQALDFAVRSRHVAGIHLISQFLQHLVPQQ